MNTAPGFMVAPLRATMSYGVGGIPAKWMIMWRNGYVGPISTVHTPVMYFLTTEKIFKGGKRLFMYSCANKDRAWGCSNRVSIWTFRRLVFFDAAFRLVLKSDVLIEYIWDILMAHNWFCKKLLIVRPPMFLSIIELNL